VIGTAGHVDHGKTTLVRALTGVDTDRLPEEKRRGISIELGFAPWRLAADIDVTLVDVPGHRRLVHTMIAGASGIELVLLVIAANEGVMPQTREHLRVCEELGMTEAVVALTKMDLVDDETLALAEAEALDLVAGRFKSSIVRCSASTGVGLGDLERAIAVRLRALAPRASDGPGRLWIDRVLTLRGAGTVVTGTLSGGTFTRGQELTLLGAGRVRRVLARELRVHERVIDVARAPTRLAVNLAIPAGDVHRGDLLTSDPAPSLTHVVDVLLRDRDLPRGAEISVHAGSMRATARVTRAVAIDEESLLARLALGEARPLRGGDRFIVRGAATSKTASVRCGGLVLDALPGSHRRGRARLALGVALRDGDAVAVLDLLLRESSPYPLDVEALGGRFAVSSVALGQAVAAKVATGELVVIGSGVLARATLSTLADYARALVRDHVLGLPLDRGLPLATLRQKLTERAGPHAAEAAIVAARARRAKEDPGLLAIEGDRVVLAGDKRRLDPALIHAIERARSELASSGAYGTSATRVAEVTGLPRDEARAVLAAIERQGESVRLDDLWFAREFVDTLRAAVVDHFSVKASLTVIEFKSLGSLARKQAVLVLEHFDQIGLTRREGDARILAESGRGG
jgi:selenocysteine-specific elongation factor